MRMETGAHTRAGQGWGVVSDTLSSLTEPAVPTPRSVRGHLEAQGCCQAGCFLASSPTVLLNDADVRRHHIQAWKQVYDGLGAGNRVGKKF